MAHDRVIVLGGATTPLAVVRCLNQAGIRPVVLSCSSSDILKYSRQCDFVSTHLDGATDDEILLWLMQYSQTLSGKHFIIPCNDRFALFLANHKATLSESFMVWENEIDDIECLVEKTRLYERSRALELPVPPGINEPCDEELEDWLGEYAPPYFVKPAYKGIPGASLAGKNRIYGDKAALLEFVRSNGVRHLVIQKMLASGDGNLFDVYGLNNANGVPVILETHKRIRQWPPDRGITSYGEIPIAGDKELAARILDMTRRLFEGCRYHGIYGVEWLRDPATDEIYLIDVNARPFSSIGHLADSGINLPYLAVKEIDHELHTVRVPASAKHTFWIHFSRDVFSAVAHIRRKKDLNVARWIGEVVSARSFAFWRIKDLGPFLVANYRFVKNLGSIIVHRRKTAR